MGRQKRLAYFEFARGSKHQGRVTIELYTDLTPATTAYFIDLITASKGKAGYLGTTLSKVVEAGFIAGGELKDITKPSILNESFERRHAHAGVLSMANNQSQFTITLDEQKHLDGKNIVIGQVVSGMEVLREIAKVPVDLNERPRIPITITSCGIEDSQEIAQ